MHARNDDRGHGPAPAGHPLGDGLSLEERTAEIRRLLDRSAANSLAVYDQLLTQLRQTAEVLGEVVRGPSLPPGQRVLLVEALAGLLQSAIRGLEYEVQVGAGLPDVHLRALAPLLDVDYFAHESPTDGRRSVQERVALAGLGRVPVGENIARGYSTPVAAFEGWYRSAGHHRTMLGAGWTALGTGNEGDLWTQNFATLGAG